MSFENEELTDLIARCAIKDQNALKQVYEKTSPFLNHVAFKILRSEELSNEVLQEAFIQIWNKAGEYRPHIAKPLTWMTSIVRYRALDKLSVEKKHWDNLDDSSDTDTLEFDLAEGPEVSTILQQEQTFLVECLQTLNDRMNESFRLAYLHGHSREDIAEKFQTNANTVKSWLRRGVEKIKKCIDGKMAINH